MGFPELFLEATATLVLVVGADGSSEFGQGFGAWAARWEAAAARGGFECVRVGPGGSEEAGETDRERLQRLLTGVGRSADAPLWLVYLGHGTFDGEHAHWNLRGPDVEAEELAEWLEPIERPTAVVVCAASSAPFLNRLSRSGRTIVTATRSGHEYSYSRFGDYLSSALGEPAADLDKDDQVSLLEAFLFASAAVADFYESQGRLASEHALIDDNGDGQGTPASWFRGIRVTETPAEDRSPDGQHAHRLHLIRSARERAWPAELLRRRDELESELEGLRRLKPDLAEDAYYARLEALLLRLARVYEEADGDAPAEESVRSD